MKRTLLLCLCMLLMAQISVWSQSSDSLRRWAISAGIGQTTLDDETPDGQDFYLNDDQGNTFHLTIDYYLSRRLAISGGWFLESDGMVTDMADGIGYKHINMSGLQGGVKWFFFPLKWIVQPHIGAMLQANVLNLGTMSGSGQYVADQGWPGSRFRLSWDVKCPPLCFVPQIGMDIHLFSTVSLCLDADYRFGVGGHNRYDVTFVDGPQAGKWCHHRNSWQRPNVSLGLKIDFPARPISQRTWNNLFMLIASWIESKG